MAVAPAIFETCGIHVPPDIMSNEARSFAKALLKYNVGVILRNYPKTGSLSRCDSLRYQ